MRVRRWPLLGVLLALLWLFVRGVEATPIRVVEELLIGLAFGVPVAFALRRFYEPTVDLGRTITALPYMAWYMLIFTWELLTANLAVAYQVLAPSLPINPDVVEVPLRVETDLAITTIANSITLTPGTLTMDYDAEANSLYVHTIDGRDHESIVEPIRAWEDLALRIFDEPADPGDPVPSPSAASEADQAASSPGATDELRQDGANGGDRRDG